MQKLYDISPPLHEHTAVWPGDQALTRIWQCKLDEGANIDLSALTSTVHIGAHADAPSHYQAGAPTIDLVGLDAYLGPCDVIHAIDATQIGTQHLTQILTRQIAPRVLFRTQSRADERVFSQNFCSFSAEAIGMLAAAGVVLIGIDTPSVDPFDSKDLPAHHALLRYGMRNLEGLDLSSVAEGRYELIALPLKLVGFDASPVRAILRTY